MIRTHVPVVLAALLAAGLAPPAEAVQTVTTTADSVPGSLRQAIADANTGENIDFDPSLDFQTIVLQGGELVIDKNLQINGAGKITVSGNNSNRVFSIAASRTVTLQGLTIRYGIASGPGGGILNAGTLSLVNATVTECSAAGGGGGIANYGAMTVTRSTISRNTATGAYGGGIDNVFGGDITMTNSTVSGNVAVLGNGGGIDNFGTGSTAVVRFSTIAFNRALGTGGGIHTSEGELGAVSIEGTILSSNGAGTSPDCSGELVSLDYNLVRSSSGCSFVGIQAHDRSGDPRLGALQLNGGTVPTHPLRPGSDAMDMVPIAECAHAGGVDSRTLARPQDGTATGSTSCDIGAYEARTPIVVNSLFDPTEEDACTLRDAIAAANTNAPVEGCATSSFSAVGDRIVFRVNGRIRLTAGLLQLTEGVLVDGPGATKLTVSGERASRVFYADSVFGQSFSFAGLTIANGKDTGAGGGGLRFAFVDGPLNIDSVAFEDNVSTASGGGSLAVNTVPRGVEITGSTFVNTSGQSAGASVWLIHSPVTIRNSTVGETRSEYAVLAQSSEAGNFSLVDLVGSTVRGSEPTGVGSRVQGSASPGSSLLFFRNSIIAGHGTDVRNVTGGLTFSGGYNVVGDASSSTPSTGDLMSTDPKLGDLLWGGGETKTMALLPGSPAIEHIPLARCLVFADQRGVPRPLDGYHNGDFKCDSGAFETPFPIVVNSLLDTPNPVNCCLRDAIAAANTNASVNGCFGGLAEAPDLITFGVNGTINLGSELAPTESVAIRGPGATKLTLSGQGITRVFNLGLFADGDYTLSGLTIANGQADFGAGVLGSLAHTVAVSESTFRNNLATANGGAFYAQVANAIQFAKSTFTNPSGTSVNFISFLNSAAVVESSTINDSSSGRAIGSVSQGGGAAAYLLVKDSTVQGTSALGIVSSAQSGAAASDNVIEYSRTIVSGHATSFDLAGGTGVSLGYNLSSDATGNLTATGDKPSMNPMLGPLGYHGGETPVFNFLPASPAKDAIPTASCGPTFDQRGFARPFSSACDIGAVERRPGGDVSGDGNVTVSDILYLINFLFAGGPVPVGEGDMNGDGALNVSDILYLINRLFAGGPAPV